MPDLNFDVTDRPMPLDVKTMFDGLITNNQSRQLPIYQPRPLAVLLRNDSTRVIAGLNGQTTWNWLYVDMLWVDPLLRNKGLGTQLLQRAEAEAKQRGCEGSYLWTQSYEAPNFYEKQGYSSFVTLQLTDGHTRRGYMKILS
jgi:GNAT superfamily N-acetyltransferase